jgi:hypothetical protein
MKAVLKYYYSVSRSLYYPVSHSPVSHSRYCVDCKIKIHRRCHFIATSLGSSDVGFAARAAVLFLGCSSQVMSLVHNARAQNQEILKDKMTTSTFNATVVYTQGSQRPADKRLAWNLMINMLSKKTDKAGKTQNVPRIAEVLAITQTNRLPNRKRLLQLVECYGSYDNESMSSIMRRNMMQK